MIWQNGNNNNEKIFIYSRIKIEIALQLTSSVRVLLKYLCIVYNKKFFIFYLFNALKISVISIQRLLPFFFFFFFFFCWAVFYSEA